MFSKSTSRKKCGMFWSEKNVKGLLKLYVRERGKSSSVVSEKNIVLCVKFDVKSEYAVENFF